MRDLTLPARWRIALLLPALIIFTAFWLIPIGVLVRISAGNNFFDTYAAILGDSRYLTSLWQTVLLSLIVTAATIVLSVIAGLFLSHNEFAGKRLLVSLLTLPLAFPGVVVGFMVIMLAGRQGLIGSVSQALLGHKLVFAYSMSGLFLGYLYFSIPKIVLSVMAAAQSMDQSLAEAAHSLGAGSWEVMRDVTLPALTPALIASGAICFAISIGAFGTAFTLATDINVLPMTIYTEFTLNANLVTAAALSVILGIVTWAILMLARNVAGTTMVAGG
ncbi:ABC transporter permease [Paralcaligenes sp. KSB-10]|uniref:ABC transporter permease n=1 Tax=Paralcaligenes sp. KSB-10 TaxID=2901142 RepID=UPI001E4A7525|nr:ABC transporter permease [Paralcaligenes sp. KSB-10]UHL63030.1 ABC transporter permease [Paralcaligenes sp. KSB-10]